MSIFSKYAARYLESGYSVMPLNGKHPILLDWSRYSSELPTDEHIENWASFEDANIGLVCGKASGVIAFDYDYTSGDSERIETIVREIIPMSPVIKVGKKGWTAFYRYNGIGSTSVHRNNDTIFDLLSDGKQTVLPPSIHPDTEEPYRWSTPDSLLDVSQVDLPEITVEMLDKLRELSEFDFKDGNNPFGAKAGRHTKIVAYGWAIIDSVGCREELASKLIEYDKLKNPDNNYFLDKKYFKGKSVIDAAKSIARRIEKHVVKSKKSKGIEWEIGKTQRVNHVEVDIGGEIGDNDEVGIDFFINEYPGFWYDVYLDEKTKEERERPDYIGLANTLKDANLIKTLGEISYSYRDGYWSRIGDTAFDSLLFKLTKNKVKPNHINNFRRTIRAVCYSSEHDSANDGLLNLRNGVLNIKTGELLKHSNKYLFFNRVEVDYDANAKCPLWESFLNDTFNGDKEIISLAQEMLGYTILGGYPFLHRAFVLSGSGRNGKSTFLDIFKHIIGYGATSVSLKLLDKPFSVVNLDGKIANLIEETPTGLVNSEEFKTAVGGGYLTAAQKGEPEYQLKVKARFIFACNDIPTFDDKNKSILDRLVILPFDNYIPVEKRDYFIGNKIKEEASGIINWALIGALRVTNNLALTMPAKCDELSEEFRISNDPLYAWFKENIEINKNARELSTKSLYKAYCWDMEAQNNRPLSLKVFGKRFSSILREKTNVDVKLDNRIRVNGQQVRGYDGISYVGAQNISMVELNIRAN